MRIKLGWAALLLVILLVGGSAERFLSMNGRSPRPGPSVPPSASNQADAAVPASPRPEAAAESAPAPVAMPAPSIQDDGPRSQAAAAPSASESAPSPETDDPPASRSSAPNSVSPPLPPAAAVPAPAPALSDQPPNDVTLATSALSSMWPSGEAGLSQATRRAVQEALRRKGYYSGPLDGMFGPLTRAAIRRFQQDLWVTVTGYLTAAQVNRLLATKAEPDRAM